jgi:hypothetical protein
VKSLTLLLAGLNALLAVALIGFSLTPKEAGDSTPLWLAIKTLAAFLVLAAFALTWLHNRTPLNVNLMLLSGLSLVALGAAAAVWTIHLALATGDMEGYMLAYAGSLAAQGALIVWGLIRSPANLAAG